LAARPDRRSVGWPAAKTLEVAQELYDGQGKKIITYPRGGAGVGVGEILAGQRWDSFPKIMFAPDSPLEEAGFEPSVPLAR